MSDSAPSSGHRSDLQDSKPAGIDWLATTAGALAAVTSALLLSTLGAVGTLLGAAVGSVAATIGTNLYSQWLAKSREKVARAQALARWRSAGIAGARGRSNPVSESVAEAASVAEDESAVTTDDAGRGAVWRERLRTLPWKRIGLASLAMFVVVIAAITIIELLAGRSVSSMVGGEDQRTTISGVTGDSGKADRKQRQDPSPGATPTPEESSSPRAEPSEDVQQSDPAVPDEGEAEEPSAEPSTGSSAEPQEQPSGGLSEAPPSVEADQTTP
ncbi:hypothetical protein [Nocardioides albus]|uniref:Uncharacterized protein n=1 Tax=Nocardioides albus TaxID=1841 RepID=A0A7W5A8V8_9ACTN|nr:hypothetical protein [Nocardioides albus]MBB3091535.1 hypothetical protein [Nocardioides albus]